MGCAASIIKALLGWAADPVAELDLHGSLGIVESTLGERVRLEEHTRQSWEVVHGPGDLVLGPLNGVLVDGTKGVVHGNVLLAVVALRVGLAKEVALQFGLEESSKSRSGIT